MDIASILGLIIAIGGCLIGYMHEGGAIAGLISVSSGFIVLGATIGATFLSLPMKLIKQIPTLLKMVFFEQRVNYTDPSTKLPKWPELPVKKVFWHWKTTLKIWTISLWRTG